MYGRTYDRYSRDGREIRDYSDLSILGEGPVEQRLSESRRDRDYGASSSSSNYDRDTYSRDTIPWNTRDDGLQIL